eukprot:scaffold83181_cov25-Tisochrysis_lutea.AAC.2
MGRGDPQPKSPALSLSIEKPCKTALHRGVMEQKHTRRVTRGRQASTCVPVGDCHPSMHCLFTLTSLQSWLCPWRPASWALPSTACHPHQHPRLLKAQGGRGNKGLAENDVINE